MNDWNMPNQTEMDQIEASTPVRILDLVAGHFSGMIEETETILDEDGKESRDRFNLIIRVGETGNPDHVGKLMLYTLWLKDKKGRFSPRAYRWLAALRPEITDGGAFHPTMLHMIEFTADVEYNGKFWNLNNPKFIKKHEDYSFD